MMLIYLPLPSTEKGFSCGFCPTNSPRPTSISCTTIDCTFINKNEPVRFICSNPGKEHGSFLNASFESYTRKLKLTVSDIPSQITNFIPSSCYIHLLLKFSRLLSLLQILHAFPLVPCAAHPGKHRVYYLLISREAVK